MTPPRSFTFPAWRLLFPNPRQVDPAKRVTIEASLARLVTLCPEIGKWSQDLQQVLCGVPVELRDPLILAPLLRFAYLVNSLPASSYVHNAQPGGLLLHSVEVGLTCASKAGEMTAKGILNPPAENPWRLVLSTYYAGLVHDLGKIGFVKVEQHDRHWNGSGYLGDWLDVKEDEFTISKLPSDKYGIKSHEAYSLTYLHLVLPSAVLYKLGTELTNNLYAAVSHSLKGEETYPIYDIMKSSDHQVTTRTPRSLPGAAKPGVPAPDGYILGTSDILDFIRTIPVVSAMPTVSINQVPGHLFVSQTHTVVVLDDANGNSITSIVHTHLRNKLGATVPYYQSSNPRDIITQFASQLSNSGESMAVIGQIPTPTITHQVKITDGKREWRGLSMVFANEVLWPNSQHQKMGFFRGTIRFLAPDGKTPSLDQEDVGFVDTAREVARIGKPPAKPEPIPTKPVDEMNLANLDQVTLQLWAGLARLLPLPDHLAHLEKMDRMVQRGNLTVGESIQVLEGCVDRIRLIAGTTDRKLLPLDTSLIPGREVTGRNAPAPDSAPLASAPAPPSGTEGTEGGRTVSTSSKSKSGDPATWVEIVLALYRRRLELPAPAILRTGTPFLLTSTSHLIIPWPYVLQDSVSMAQLPKAKAGAAQVAARLQGRLQALLIKIPANEAIRIQTIIVPFKQLAHLQVSESGPKDVPCYVSGVDFTVVE